VAIKIDALSREIAKQLTLYTAEIKEAVEDAKEEISKEAIARLRQTSPKDSHDYSKGWTRKKVGNDVVIYNKNKGQLTHVLEHGHVKVGGGRVSPKVHIRPAEEQANRDFVNKVEKAIKS
jgi:hypothetical protein